MNNSNHQITSTTTPLNKINILQQFPPMKQEEKNRKMLEELQRQKRQMMQKNASSTNRPTNLQTIGPISSGSERDLSTPSGMGPSITPTSLASKVNLAEGTIMFIPVNSQFGNSIIPVFPRIAPET
ncbi:unnamed protein product [Meloidogyne enterolobii]|uniref:Uncharacterized protein n=1 Tax=Meloidogyne enterolobii TaxID=390850 RepID=A0ACB0Z6N3_MELEN